MSFTSPTKPNIPDYTVFLRAINISSTYLPDNSPFITVTFNVAMEVVNQDLLTASPYTGVLAIYNLATDRLINYAADVDGSTFFRDKRREFGLLEFAPGVIAGTGDSSTSASLLNQEFMRNLTLGDLQTLKTPYGRAYMAIAQDYGPNPYVLV